MGLADVLFSAPVWTLVSQDDGTEIHGQFPPTNLVENVAGVWAEQATLGLDQPIIQFIRGALETITFDAKVWATHHGILTLGKDDIDEDPLFTTGPFAGRTKVSDLRDLARPDPDLGRPHVWLLTVGEQFSQVVVVRSVGGIRYDRMRSVDGTLRGVLFSMELARYVEYTIETVAAAESLVVVAQEGDYYETIAKRVFKDPIIGEALRRRNPDKRHLATGDKLHVPIAKTLRAEIKPLVPQALFLDRGSSRATALRQLTFDIHGEPKPTHILRTDFP